MQNMCPRPRKFKVIKVFPSATYFKPRGKPLSDLKEVVLSLEDLEALRLNDLENLKQEDSASKMGIHQSTFQRIVKRARKKITDALINGKAIRIGGE